MLPGRSPNSCFSMTSRLRPPISNIPSILISLKTTAISGKKLSYTTLSTYSPGSANPGQSAAAGRSRQPSVERDQLPIEDQCAVGPDLRTHLPVPICEMRRNIESPLAPRRPQLHPFRPAFDHPVQRERRRLTPPDRTVKDRPIGQCPVIVTGHLIGCLRPGPFALHQD